MRAVGRMVHQSPRSPARIRNQQKRCTANTSSKSVGTQLGGVRGRSPAFMGGWVLGRPLRMVVPERR